MGTIRAAISKALCDATTRRQHWVGRTDPEMSKYILTSQHSPKDKQAGREKKNMSSESSVSIPGGHSYKSRHKWATAARHSTPCEYASLPAKISRILGQYAQTLFPALPSVTDLPGRGESPVCPCSLHYLLVDTSIPAGPLAGTPSEMLRCLDSHHRRESSLSASKNSCAKKSLQLHAATGRFAGSSSLSITQIKFDTVAAYNASCSAMPVK